ncbi:MAG: TonB-dependent receptor [Candidatus Eisenbacteria bacterium]|nr:TonB-dependent receptor [Candidatus Eisenbacteria bacterium]
MFPSCFFTRAARALGAAVCGLAATALAVSAGAAQTAPADTAIVEIEGTSVLGSRTGTTRGGSSVVHSDIDSLPLPAAASLREVIEELPSVHVRTNSRGETELSIRGSESRQVSVLYDGLPLTLSWDGRTDVSVIPVGAMRQVTLVPGLSTILTGPNVLGGMIDFRSHAGAAPDHSSLEAGAGVDASGGFGATASISVPRRLRAGVLTARAGAGHRDSPGATKPAGIVQPILGERLRINTDAAASDAFASLRFDHEGGAWTSLASSAYREERGIAAELGVSEPRYWRYPFVARSLSVLSAGSGARRAPWGGAASLQASFGLDAGRTEIDAYDSILYDSITSEEDGEQVTLSMRATASQTLGRNADLRLGVTSSQLTYDEFLTPGATSRYRHRLWSVAGETIVRRPFEGGGPLEELDLSLGLALDRSTNPLAGGKPGVGALDEPGARAGLSAVFSGGAVTVHASANRRARFPSLRELYSGALNRFTPNPDLKPERLVAGEVGVMLRDRLGQLQVVAFTQRLSDAVVRIRESGRFKRVNQEGLKSRGVELIGSRRFGGLSLGADFTAQTADLLDPSAQLEHPENLPETSGSLRAELSLPRRFRLGASARWIGEQFALHPDSGELETLASATTLGVNVARDWRLGGADGWASTLRTTIAVDNLTDKAVFDAYGLPGPGQLLRFEMRVN